MKIIVCIKQVPNTSQIKINLKDKTLIRDSVESIINPFDLNALEVALQLKDRHGADITVISMGPHSASESLRTCMGMGAHRAVLISDKHFAGSDTYATSYILAKSIEQLGNYDLIICGKQSIDGDTGQVGSQLAEHLGIPQITNVTNLKYDDGFICKRECENKYEIIEAASPALVTVLRGINKPRFVTLKGRLRASKLKIEHFDINRIDVDSKKIGLKGSPTRVISVSTPDISKDTIKLKYDGANGAIKELVNILDTKIGVEMYEK